MKKFGEFTEPELKKYFAEKVKMLALDFGFEQTNELYNHTVKRLVEIFSKRPTLGEYHFEKAISEMLKNKSLYKDVTVSSIVSAFYNSNER